MPSNRQKEAGGTETSGNSPAGSLDPASIPAISLPKGGGSIRGIGEKFAANPVTGTGSSTVPLATSPGRSGFGPQLALSYNSGGGNGPFGFGWDILLPSITRKTDKGLPRYEDAQESDVFILSGQEDLVPALVNTNQTWQPETLPERTVDGKTYRIRRYCLRIEGLFARIERWTNIHSGQTHWRSISKNNITTVYGKVYEDKPHPCIADPNDPSKIFSWLICESYDDKGNAIYYEYATEDDRGVDLSLANERNRNRTAQRYLKRIKYGNRTPRKQDEDLSKRADWMFEVVFDYGEHDPENPTPQDGGAWLCRHDPFSFYRAGFEVRTYRLCQRTLMFHHFPGEEGVGRDCLVRSTDFAYRNIRNDPDDVKKGNPVASFIASITQTGYKRRLGVGYLKKSLPSLEFGYSQVAVQEEVREIEGESLENLPYGLDDRNYQWVDLDGEGVSGILTEQANAWFYKPNLGEGRFGPIEKVAVKPSLAALSGGRQQLLDLAGDGQLDLVEFSGPLPGFHERTQDRRWEQFTRFLHLPGIAWDEPNLRFVDLNGDGHADVLITDNEVFTWYGSLAEEGFGPAQHLRMPFDEEKGPRLIFADGTQSIYLADMCGDGLIDLVRLRNGEVCYWPNLGYGRFGAKVTMDNAPWFDLPDQFDQRRVRLADIDGSGNNDIIYLGLDSVRLYFNQSGNSWSKPYSLTHFPRIDNLSSVRAMDLLGNGTACLVWSSTLPGEARRSMRYIDLMGGQKPHLLVKTINNLGGETVITYAPSTKFYLQDKLAGKPWVTRLPFPVHCVEKVTVSDKWRQTVFSTTYSFHHGYFDGAEREFRGFGRVEQLDVESFGKFSQGNSTSPYITDDKTLYQPPVKTVTWYNTGALIERERIFSQFETEYFPRWFEHLHADEVNVMGGFQENLLPQPDVVAADLSGEEWREALRACKGMMIRQEVYELDVDALERGEERRVKLFSTAYHNCRIQRLQAKALNRHAVFSVAESEAITYHYELDLKQSKLRPDPRIAHTLNLKFDEFSNVLQAVAVVYPRLGQFEDDTLKADELALSRRVQQETHLAYTETRYTNDIEPVLVDGALTNADTYRLRVPCEMLTYELTGINAEDDDDRASPDRRDNRYFTLDEMRRFRLSLFHQPPGEALPELVSVPEISYHQLPSRNAPQKRLVEHVRILFFSDASPVVDSPLPFSQLGALGLLYETYKLALTDDLLGAVFGAKLTPDDRSELSKASVSGYLSGAAFAGRFAGADTAGQYWMCSGVAGFAPDAAQHFYLPERFTDPFGNVTTLEYDPLDLFVESSTDAAGNTIRVTRFDFRVLAPREIQDINDNLTEVSFDVLGLHTATAVKGKENQGDNFGGLTDAVATPALDELAAFFNAPAYDEAQARRWLVNATTRHVYYFGETRNPDGSITWCAHPACACDIRREKHVTQLAAGEQSLLQTAFEYFDGTGSLLVKKVQAKPEAAGGPLRWIASGKTIINNKGKPVKEYEPYLSPLEVAHRFEEPREEGVTSVIYYDAVGRTVRTELPDGSYSRAEFSPWHRTSYDPNDTVSEVGNEWFARKMAPSAAPPDQRAAQRAAEHAGTPEMVLLDSLGRDVVSITHNHVRSETGVLKDEKYLTFTRLDAEGKPLWVRDARKNLVMQYITPPVASNKSDDPIDGYAPCYDIAGNLLFQRSMDAGDRWMLNDDAGKPFRSWDGGGQMFRTDYDRLHRPVGIFVKGADGQDANREIQFEKVIYGDAAENGLTDAQKKELNVRGKLYKRHDTAGILINEGTNPATGDREAFDFKGNLLRSSRQLAQDYNHAPDWSENPALETETFVSSARYDALNRAIQIIAPHSNRPGTKLNIIRPGYNETNLLERVEVWLEQTAEPVQLLNAGDATEEIVRNIDYNAKGQRTRIVFGNGVGTTYDYDPQTFRLNHLQTRRAADLLQDLFYTYDPVGNITSLRDNAQDRVFHSNACVESGSEYLYDALYRLVAASGREHRGEDRQPDFDDSVRFVPTIPNDCNALQNYVETYHYDSVGNILKMLHCLGRNLDRPGQVVWNRRYQYAPDSNSLLATRLPGDPDNLPDYTAAPGYSARYTYDQHGNITRMPHLPLIEWDFKDRLRMTQRQVVNDGGTGERTFYVYDADGQRVRKVTETQNGARKDERIYIGGFEVYRKYNGDGETLRLERETLHVMDDKQRVAMIETRTRLQGIDPAPRQILRYQHGNHLGSAILEMDQESKVISYEEYYPFGSTAYQAARSRTETPKRYRYTGKERDEETGLTYHGARYYAPWLGRWTSADPVGILEGVNLYAYSFNSPVNYRDPNGQAAEMSWQNAAKTEKEAEQQEKQQYQLFLELKKDMKELLGINLQYISTIDHKASDPNSPYYVRGTITVGDMNDDDNIDSADLQAAVKKLEQLRDKQTQSPERTKAFELAKSFLQMFGPDTKGPTMNLTLDTSASGLARAKPMQSKQSFFADITVNPTAITEEYVYKPDNPKTNKFDPNKAVYAFRPMMTLVHEFVHYTTGKTDPDPSTKKASITEERKNPTPGDTVLEVNALEQALGLPKRLSYHTYASSRRGAGGLPFFDNFEVLYQGGIITKKDYAPSP